MTDAGFFRGTSAEQDNRFSDKEKKLMKQMRFGENVTKKVDTSKIKIDVLRPWISKRIEDLLGMEDDVIEEFVVNQLEADKNPDGRRIQINLTGFLNGRNARIFTAELWDMLLSAQEQSTGIPASLIQSKEEEIRKRNEEQEKEKLTDTLKKTVSRFADKLKTDPDSTSPKPSSTTELPTSSTFSLSSIKREKISPEQDGGRREVDFSKRKDDGGRRQYRSRRTSSPSPSRRRSRSRSRDRERDRDRRERERDRSPPPRIDRDRYRRSPPQPIRPRERSNAVSSSSSPNRGGRRYSDQYERRGNNRNSRDRSRERERPLGRRSRSREDLRGRRRDEEVVANSGSNGSFRHPLSPRRGESRDKERSGAARDRYSSEKERDTIQRTKRRTPPEDEEVENSDHSNDSGEVEEPQAKRARKEKKNKKDKKKHKKHKKTKKSKKSKNGQSSDSEEESGSDEPEHDSDEGRRGGAASYIRNSLYQNQSSEDLEKKLRERALLSLKMKRATSSQ